MSAYYNEIEPYAADWLERLIAGGHIAPGDVDRRSIVDVQPDDLRGYDQCHFFAGIGGWSLALRLAGWPDDRPVWTGSCPCQPFSAAGKQRGSDDERHLWPAWFRLISECRPVTVFGEQVAGAAGRAWLDHVLADLEGRDYAAAAAIVPACGVGAPHIRERMWFVADAEHAERRSLSLDRQDGRDGPHGGRSETHGKLGTRGQVCLLADNNPRRRSEYGSTQLLDRERAALWNDADRCGKDGDMGHANDARLEGRRDDAGEYAGQLPAGAASPWSGGVAQSDSLLSEQSTRNRSRPSEEEGVGSCRQLARPSDSPWADLEWLACSDGKARPTQPGLFPLVAGLPKGMVRGGDPSAPINANESAEGRVGRLRAYGNSIVPQVAAEFIGAFVDATDL